MTTTNKTQLTENERELVESSAHFVLASLPKDLDAAYEIFENYAYDNCDYDSHAEECEEIFDQTATYYGLN